MSRYIDNPKILGEDVGDVAVKALGIGATAFLNDKLVYPLVQRFTPVGNVTIGKLIDTVSTYLSAWIAGQVTGFIDNSFGRDIQFGGVLLGTSKIITIVIPDFSISANFPDLGSFPFLTAANAASVPQIGAGAGEVNVTPTYSRTPVSGI